MVLSFSKKLEIFVNDLNTSIEILVNKYGTKSKFTDSKVLVPDDEFCFNLPTFQQWIEEVHCSAFRSNLGHACSFTEIDLEQLCLLYDHLVKKYSN